MKITKGLIQAAVLGCAITLTAGCSSQKAWVYKANSYPAATASTGKKVVVTPFTDGRQNENQNDVLMYMIPIVPCGWQHLDVPEGTQSHITSGLWVNYKPTEDYPKALAEDLRSTGLFSEASFDYRKGDSDYVVSGKIINTRYDGYVISYGLSVYGPLLWFVGFPAGSVGNNLSVELSLSDAKTEKPIFSKVYTATPHKGVTWIYVMENDFNYPEMLAEVNKQFCQDMQPALLANTKSP